jgi:hypothetical protein
MKPPLHTFVTILCLLALLLPAAAFCLQPHQTSQRICDHCPPRHQIPPCCTTHQQQPPAIVAQTDLSQPALSAVFTPASNHQIFLHPPTAPSELERPPLIPRLTALRI